MILKEDLLILDTGVEEGLCTQFMGIGKDHKQIGKAYFHLP